MEQGCVFKFRYGTECDEKTSLSETTGVARIETIIIVITRIETMIIINASKVYGDTLHVELETQLAENENLKIYYHRRSC